MKRQLSFNWAVSHFPDEILMDFCIVNGVSFEEITKQRTALETRSLDTIEETE